MYSEALTERLRSGKVMRGRPWRSGVLGGAGRGELISPEGRGAEVRAPAPLPTLQLDGKVSVIGMS